MSFNDAYFVYYHLRFILDPVYLKLHPDLEVRSFDARLLDNEARNVFIYGNSLNSLLENTNC